MRNYFPILRPVWYPQAGKPEYIWVDFPWNFPSYEGLTGKVEKAQQKIFLSYLREEKVKLIFNIPSSLSSEFCPLSPFWKPIESDQNLFFSAPFLNILRLFHFFMVLQWKLSAKILTHGNWPVKKSLSISNNISAISFVAPNVFIIRRIETAKTSTCAWPSFHQLSLLSKSCWFFLASDFHRSLFRNVSKSKKIHLPSSILHSNRLVVFFFPKLYQLLFLDKASTPARTSPYAFW